MTKLEHFALYVKDLEGARDFFETYFQAQSNERYDNKQTGFSSYFMRFSDGARLELMTREVVEANPRSEGFYTGYHHLAISLGSPEAVDQLTERLVADGYTLLSGPRVTGDGYYESCLETIEHLLIELTV